MTRVVHVVEGWEPEVSGDEYVPLMVDWALARSVYLQLSRRRDRIDCQLSLDRSSGRVGRFTFYEVPPAGAVPDGSIDPSEVESGLPVFDLTGFGTDWRGEPTETVLREASATFSVWDDASYQMWFRPVPAVRWIGAGPVSFAFDAADELVAIRIDRSALPSVGELASGPTGAA